VTYVITQPCVDAKHKTCIEVCPVDCIYEGDRMLYIHPDECIDCGACEPTCPVDAIYQEDDVPEDMTPYKGANEEFFEELGSPGGSDGEPAGPDVQLVAALPPRAPDAGPDGPS
jgi:NAD-dependent dihydropyrimidine dehydrogenase PreA subunit